METLDHRKNIRIRCNFPVKLINEGLDFPFEGMVANLSQKGAFIKSKNRFSLEAHAPVVLTFFLPADFTGQNKTIALQGDAVITRIDPENEAIAVEFIKTFREFERIDVPGVHEKSENRIAY
ncbi:MAG: PilZ domain-containing protein [Syntrophobacteria bacterium]